MSLASDIFSGKVVTSLASIFESANIIPDDSNATINEASSIYLNAGKLNINLTIYVSGSSTSEITIDLSSFLDINRYKSRGFVPGVYNNYTTAGFVEYYLNNGTLTLSKPSQSSGSTFSAIGVNLYIEQ